MKKYIMGIDNGGTFSKAAIFDLEGNEISLALIQTDVITPKAGYTERDMEVLWKANISVIKKAIEKANINSTSIIGISVTGHGKGLYLWGKDNKPAYNGIISTDSRAHIYAKNWQEDGTADKIFELTYQKTLAAQSPALIKWFQNNKQEVLDNTKWIFMVKDYVRFRLTGEAYAEITDYSGDNLVNLTTRKYDKKIMELFGIEDMMECLPPLKNSTDYCGSITKEVAELTGLSEGTPVSGGMFDIDACAIAMNVTNEEHICVIAGTWSINEYISKKPVLDHSVMMNSIFCIPEYYLIEESSPTSAGNNEWFVKLFAKEFEEEAKVQGISKYDLVNKIIEETKEINNIIFLPFIYGSNYNSIAKASIIGIDSHHSKGDVCKAVYEGIVFTHKVHLDKLIANRQNTKKIRLAGGAAKSDVWMQMFADILQLEVEIIDTTELGALGCAMSSAVAAGEFSSLEEAAKKMVAVKNKYIPNKELKEEYNKKFELYKKITALLDPEWDEFNK